MKTPFRAPALCTCEMLVCPLLKPTCSGPRRPGGWARGRHRRARPAAAAWPAAARARARPAWRRARRAWACRRARAPPRAPPPSARQATCWVRARGVRPQGHPQGHPASARGSLPWAHGPPGARAWACRERRALPGGRGRAWQCPLARCCASRREAAAEQPHCWVQTCFRQLLQSRDLALCDGAAQEPTLILLPCRRAGTSVSAASMASARAWREATPLWDTPLTGFASSSAGYASSSARASNLNPAGHPGRASSTRSPPAPPTCAAAGPARAGAARAARASPEPAPGGAAPPLPPADAADRCGSACAFGQAPACQATARGATPHLLPPPASLNAYRCASLLRCPRHVCQGHARPERVEHCDQSHAKRAS